MVFLSDAMRAGTLWKMDSSSWMWGRHSRRSFLSHFLIVLSPLYKGAGCYLFGWLFWVCRYAKCYSDNSLRSDRPTADFAKLWESHWNFSGDWTMTVSFSTIRDSGETLVGREPVTLRITSFLKSAICVDVSYHKRNTSARLIVSSTRWGKEFVECACLVRWPLVPGCSRQVVSRSFNFL